jgi:hypothetical protein
MHSRPQSVSEAAASNGSHKLLLAIILHDSASGKDTPWQCVSASDRAPAEERMVDAYSMADVAATLRAPS